MGEIFSKHNFTPNLYNNTKLAANRFPAGAVFVILSYYAPIKVLPHLPPTGKRWGFDLILTAKHAPDQGNLINIYK